MTKKKVSEVSDKVLAGWCGPAGQGWGDTSDPPLLEPNGHVGLKRWHMYIQESMAPGQEPAELLCFWSQANTYF